MMCATPMDRLLCGDVGFGKTEVALRAAYKAVLAGKQVAILVPTTILALQHYQTIQSRMRAFAVRTDMVSRFRTPKQIENTLARVARGDVDVIVGTHRLISSDVRFKDLGLLIVDEEQRFGVAQKEKIKALCGNVDVLTLTATPIPRTLNMAMSGIRDISVLDEAPGDRVPVQTYVLEDDALIIEEAIRRELRRGGQVFYLHNAVETIYEVAARISHEIPDARVTVAHGQMTKDELERVWSEMLTGEIDVLVSTTIVETGIDVPNANTLIVDNAHRMGLSQLHQLRGRVGRSPRRAYAYFTYPKSRALTDMQRRRLEAIREYAEFGAGFRIALRDLELRGAGNLLGAEQHGHLDAVGYDLYVKLLERAVLEERGEVVPTRSECIVSLSFDACLPERYVASPTQRMSLYKRISLIESPYDLSDMTDELLDRDGELPRAASNLLQIALMRSLAERAGATNLRDDHGTLIITLPEPEFPLWMSLADEREGRMKLVLGTPPTIRYRMEKGTKALDDLVSLFLRYHELSHMRKEETT
jgi:transcription-repair coupling factor (superfamily II helicase)